MSLFSLFVYLLPIGTEIYGSIRSNDSCNLLVNQTCRKTPSATDTGTVIKSEPKSIETPLILPDTSPKSDDSSSGEDDENPEKIRTKDNDVTKSEKETTNGDADDSSEDFGNGDLLLPFP
jgi:hypothetical protein